MSWIVPQGHSSRTGQGASYLDLQPFLPLFCSSANSAKLLMAFKCLIF